MVIKREELKEHTRRWRLIRHRWNAGDNHKRRAEIEEKTWHMRGKPTKWNSFFILSLFFSRNSMSSRRLFRPWSTQFHPQHPITLRCGQRLHPPTAMSVRGCYGASLVRACAAQSVALNATRSARTCSMQIVYKVRNKTHRTFIKTKRSFPGPDSQIMKQFTYSDQNVLHLKHSVVIFWVLTLLVSHLMCHMFSLYFCYKY